jgi:multiple sugar transport system ATP-binding protein
MAEVRLEGVCKGFPGGRTAVRDLTLRIADGEFLVLVGPSGCGKSTTLRLVAGLEAPTGGTIRIGDRDVTGLQPQERDVAMVFQSYALYPHKTVRENLAFPLRMRGTAVAEIPARVMEAARVLGIGDLLDLRPRQLSGGQRQRVALGRAIVRAPSVFLLDEPLSNLDARLRVRTRAELARIHQHLGTTMLYVTHDQEEAMTLGDRIAVMQEGVLQQVAPPLDVYRTPANVFVAGFIGSPAINLLPCALDDQQLRGRSFRFPSPGHLGAAAGREGLLVGSRPQDATLVGGGDGDLNGTVDMVEPLGPELLAHVALAGEQDGEPFRVLAPSDTPLARGMEVGIRLRRDRAHVFDRQSGRRLGTLAP